MKSLNHPAYHFPIAISASKLFYNLTNKNSLERFTVKKALKIL